MKNLTGLFYAIISSATFGLIPLLALPIVAAGMDNSSILFYRFSISALIMGIIALMKRSDFTITFKQGLVVFLLGFFYAATALILMEAYTRIPSGIATTIHFLYPVMVSTIMIFFFKEKASKGLLIATLMSLAGVGILSWTSNGSVNPVGILIALTSIFTYALYIVGIHKSSVKKMDEFALTFYVLFFSSFIFLANALMQGGIQAIPDTNSGINILLLALFPTVVSDLTLVLAIKHIGSTTTSILGSMEPVTAVTIGVLVFNEPFGMRVFIGMSLILVAVILVILSKQTREENLRLLDGILRPLGLNKLLK
ncbi:MAG: DMT family transporter [Bacteroidales bacterium]